MRIVHTSDWHAGRMWKNLRRLDELESLLNFLADHVTRDDIDLLLISGDVFDSGAPIAEAERLVFRFLRRVGEAGVRTVVIAGNHDSPARLQAWGSLAELAGVQVVARPQPADKGGILRFNTKRGEQAVIAAVPFAATRDLVSAATLAADETAARQRYADGLRRIVTHLCEHFDPQAINILMAHTHIEGAVLSGSEREVHVGEEWAATAQALPANAHYIALGHIHRPQTLNAAPSPTEYAGSLMQLDFGEEGEEKSFVIVQAEPGRPARIERIRYEGAKPLRTIRAGLAELEARSTELATYGWLRIRVPIETFDPDLNSRVRRVLSNAVAVHVELPEAPADGNNRPPAGTPPIDVFRAYFRDRHGSEPDDALVTAFDDLLAHAKDSL
jgi:DNA repair protein SbcD/Mre11